MMKIRNAMNKSLQLTLQNTTKVEENFSKKQILSG